MKKLILIGLLVLLVISIQYIWRKTVNAQGETTVSVSPKETILFLNGDVTIQSSFFITNAVEIVGFDVIVAYDETLLTLDGWDEGGFLFSPWCFTPENYPGYIQLVCSQLSMMSVSGEGVLFTLDFTGVSPGVSSIEINKAEMTNLESQLIQAQKVDGTLTVGYAASTVGGNFFLQGQTDRAGIPISLGAGVTYSQGHYKALSAPILGQNLVLPSVVNNDTYTLTTDQPRYLNLDAILGKTVTVPPGVDMDISMPPLRLLAGDAVGDNIINTADLDAIRDAFGVMGEGIKSDVNYDGVVDLRDLALAGGNFGMTPSAAYGGWLP